MKRSFLLSKTSVSTLEEFSQMVLELSSLDSFITCPEAAEVALERSTGGPQACSELSRRLAREKRQSLLEARTWGSFSHSLKITQMMLTARIRPTKPSNTSGLFIED